MVRAVGEPQSHHNLGSVLRHLVVPLGLDSTCFLLRLRFLRALDDRVFPNVPSLRWPPIAFISSILLLFVSMSEYHRGILGFFALVGSLVPLVLTLYLLPTLIINPFAFPFQYATPRNQPHER